LRTASDGIFLKGLYILLAIILLHDIFAPHSFLLSLILSDGNLSVQALDDSHPSTAEFFEDDENTSVPNRRGTLLPALSVNFNVQFNPSFHPLLLIAADERPPKA
jgi:hypothetical protein